MDKILCKKTFLLFASIDIPLKPFKYNEKVLEYLIGCPAQNQQKNLPSKNFLTVWLQLNLHLLEKKVLNILSFSNILKK